ncbi:hypothetical protein [uncultured Ruminococcus sp.]|uniref:hypothetical protein n=1 Tax=uncultured Ruminococcus sp. TaxID=165186 RepID=UPI0025DB4ED5|nr:hypothetical protein [uncultured Ruminococcus sp.]
MNCVCDKTKAVKDHPDQNIRPKKRDKTLSKSAAETGDHRSPLPKYLTLKSHSRPHQTLFQ